MSTEKPAEKRSEEIQTLAKGFAVIKAFSASQPKLTLSEIARATGLTRAGARRILLTLRALGYVTSDERYFRLEPRVLELGYAYLSTQPWWESAQAVVGRVAESLDQPVAVGVMDQDSLTYVAHAQPRRLEAFPRSVGTRIPLGTSAMGRVLLASLADDELDARLKALHLVKLTKATIVDADALRKAVLEVKEDGYALIDQELEVGFRTLAVPIRSRSGRVTAAIGVGSTAVQFDKKTFVEKYLDALQSASAEISARLPA